MNKSKKFLENPFIGSLVMPVAILMVAALIIFGASKLLFTDLRTFFDNSSDAMLMLHDGVFFDCNPATQKMLGYENKTELLRCKPWDISPEYQPDGRKSVVKAEEMMKAAFDKGSTRFEWVHRKKDQSDIPVEVSLTAIPYKGIDVLHVVWRDISDRKLAEQALEDSKPIDSPVTVRYDYSPELYSPARHRALRIRTCCSHTA